MNTAQAVTALKCEQSWFEDGLAKMHGSSAKEVGAMKCCVV